MQPQGEPGADPLLAVLAKQASTIRDEPGLPERRDRRLAAIRGLVEPYQRYWQPLPPRVIERVSCEGYTRERIELGFLDGMLFKAYVLIPEPRRQPMPAVLAVHGHGYGSRQLVGLRPDGSINPGAGTAQQFAVELVRRGLLVVAPDVVGFGERQSAADHRFDPEAPYACYRLAMTLIMHGLTVAGLRTSELLGMTDYLRGRDDVDPRRIGIIGFSGGATLSMLTSILDDQLAASVLIGFPNTYAASILSVRHCTCNYLPGILSDAEEPDLLSLIAPRPLFVESGQVDPIFPVAGFQEAVERLRQAWADAVPQASSTARAETDLGVDLHPGAHQVSGRASFDWLAQRLSTPSG